MIGFSHVFLHVAFCNAILREPPDATVSVHVRLLARSGRDLNAQVDQTFRFTRGDQREAVAEFDAPTGIYELEMTVPKEQCSRTDFVSFISEHNRTIAETLDDGSVPAVAPVTLMQGAAPATFLYVKPTFVLFDKSQACDKPIGTPVASHIVVENDRDAYYVWLYEDATSLQGRDAAVVALKLATATGLAHYIRVPIAFPVPWAGWPRRVQFNVSEDEIDALSTEKTDTLLCPKLWQTSVG